MYETLDIRRIEDLIPSPMCQDLKGIRRITFQQYAIFKVGVRICWNILSYSPLKRSRIWCIGPQYTISRPQAGNYKYWTLDSYFNTIPLRPDVKRSIVTPKSQFKSDVIKRGRSRITTRSIFIHFAYRFHYIICL